MFAIVPTVGFRPGNVGATPNSLTLSTLAFSDDGNGVPDALTATYEYTGADNLELVAVTSTAATPPGADAAAQKTNIINGTGTGNLEEFVVDLSDSATAITGLTSTSESATRIHGFLREKTNGATSDIVTVTVTGLDFTVGTFSSAATTSSTVVEVTFSELQYGTADVTHATVKVGGTAVTVSGASVVSGKLQLTLGSALAGGETLLASYTNAGELSDKDGNALTAFTDQSVTNNVSGAATFTEQYSTEFTVASDTSLNGFDGGVWTQGAGSGVGEVDNFTPDRAKLSATGTFNDAVHDISTTLTNDQYAEATFESVTGSNREASGGPGVRIAYTATPQINGYVANYWTDGDTAPNNAIRLMRYDDGTGTQLGSDYAIVLVAGDTWRIRAEGTTISVDVDTGAGYVEVITATDATYSSGKAGTRGYHADTARGVFISTFAAGDIS